MPTKVFDAFTRLDASDVNAYLANKSISNAIINGAFDFNQRGFTSLTASGYGHDRWRLTAGGDGTTTYTPQTFTPGAAPFAGNEAVGFARVVTTGQTNSLVASLLAQRVEDVRTFAGQTVTISFYAKSGSGTPQISLQFLQNFGSGGSTDVNTFVVKHTLSTSWERYTASVTVPSISGKTLGAGSYLNLLIWVSAGSTFNSSTDSLGIQSNTFDIWGVQLEAGTVANDFRRNANSIQGELAACQRYYWRLSEGGNYRPYGTGVAGNTTSAEIIVNHPTMMRIAPTSVDFSNTLLGDGATGVAVTAITLSNANLNKTFIICSVASGLTQYRPYNFLNNGGVGNAGFFGLSAEL